jgi:hypothetical protein
MRRISLAVLLVVAVSISLTALASTATLADRARQAKPSGAPATGGPTADTLITVADVEKVGGLTGIKQTVQGDRLTFTTADNKTVLRVLVRSGGSLFKLTKTSKASVHASVSGIGDDAFDGPADDMNMAPSGPDGKPQRYLLWFVKANTSVSLTTFANTSHPDFYLSQDKLRALAKIMVSRF